MIRLVEKNRLVELLDNKDKRVRNACSNALEKFYPNSEGVIEKLISSINKYDNECLSLAAIISRFTPSNNDIINLVKLFNSIDPEKNEYSMSIHYHLKSCLLSFPFEVLEKNHDIINFNEELSEVYKIVENRTSIKSQDPDYLWDELYNLCNNYKDKPIEGNDRQSANLLFEGLCRYPEHIKHKVIMFLNHETKEKYHFEEYMVQLAGEFKINETIPFLFRIFLTTDCMHIVNDLCIRSLGKIGSLEVVNEIGNIYASFDDDQKLSISEILKYIPYDYSENFAISLLENEKDKVNKTFLSGVLCDIFSLKGMSHVLHMIKEKEYDPTIMALFDYLLPVYIYHKIKIENLSKIEYNANIFQENEMKNNSFYKIAAPLHEEFNEYSNKQNISKKLKRNKHKNNVVPIVGGGSKRRSRRRKKSE